MFLEVFRSGMLPLIKELSESEYITNNFKLVGGTALALYFGHRISVDIDLFSDLGLDTFQLDEIFIKLNGTINSKSDFLFTGNIGNVKVDLVKYPYQLKNSVNFVEKIQIGNLEDLIPMKLMTLSQRGLKKDFADVFEIMKRYQLIELKNMILNHYGERNINFYNFAMAITYFEDAENGPDIETLNNTEWGEIKSFFLQNKKKIIDTFIQE
jgi:predicted nucleotidyltransferase component of viral defense system